MFLVVLFLVVYLDAVPHRLQDEDPVVRVDVDRYRPAETPFRLHVGPAAGLDDVGVGVDVGLGPRRWLLGVTNQGGDKGRVGPVNLNPVVAPK